MQGTFEVAKDPIDISLPGRHDAILGEPRGTSAMKTTLIVRPAESLMTFSEWMLCRGAAQCGAPGACFVETLLRLATLRSLCIPAMLAQEPDAYSYSSAREVFWQHYGRPEPCAFDLR